MWCSACLNIVWYSWISNTYPEFPGSSISNTRYEARLYMHCQVLRTAISNGSQNIWKETTVGLASTRVSSGCMILDYDMTGTGFHVRYTFPTILPFTSHLHTSAWYEPLISFYAHFVSLRFCAILECDDWAVGSTDSTHPNKVSLTTTWFIVDSYHYINHHTTDYLCHKWCNPAPLNGSASNLMVVEHDVNGNAHYKHAFNTQICHVIRLN